MSLCLVLSCLVLGTLCLVLRTLFALPTRCSRSVAVLKRHEKNKVQSTKYQAQSTRYQIPSAKFKMKSRQTKLAARIFQSLSLLSHLQTLVAVFR